MTAEQPIVKQQREGPFTDAFGSSTDQLCSAPVTQWHPKDLQRPACDE